MLIIAIKAFIVPVLQLNNSPEELNFNWWERCQNIYHLCISTIDGISFYNFFFGIPLDNGTNLSISTLVIQSLVVLFLCFYFLKNRSKNKLSSYYKNNSNIIYFWLFNGLIIIFLFLQILTTKQAGGPHHAFMLFPFIHFLNISAILLIYRILLKETVKLDYLKKNILKIVLVIVIAILLFF
jgi:FlaA1/EpsC-like NDP-sugar epimerase